MPIIIEKLNYTYSPGTPFEKAALKDVSLTVNDGDFFGIIGHTGSGKSTLISHFNGLMLPENGSIKVDEFDLTLKKKELKKQLKALRAHVGMVFQYPEYQLFDETVEKDVGFGPKNLGLPAQEIKERVIEAIELVGLDYTEIAQRSPFELSGGQKRRVALAGVLSMRPKILVLDEPTAGLDPRGKNEIIELLFRIKRACPTIIMISHNMDEIARCCNRIAVMSRGEIRGVFSPGELFYQKEMLEELRLGLPSAFSVALKLRERGINVEGHALDADGLASAIIRAAGKVATNA